MLQAAANTLRFLRDVCVLNANRLVGREYIPNITEQLYVEPTSICNLSCRFCGYRKKRSPKTVMEYERFAAAVDQATGLGYSTFNLTPLTGEVFTDKGLFGKLSFLEQHPKVAGYSFFSNFVLAGERTIGHLLELTKLKSLTVSLYGHDRDSFMAITQSNEQTYRRLVANLLALEERLASRRFTLEVGWRAEHGFGRRRTRDGELAAIIERFRDVHRVRVRISRQYNNWGGLIRQEDLDGLAIRIRRAGEVYKKGACALIFFRLLIMADGRVNACACRDVDGTLCIGDLKEQPLRQILSASNERYMTLIRDQQQARFGSVCRDCDMYRSIYRRRRAYRSHKDRPVGLDDFFRQMRQRMQPLTQSGPE